MPPPVAAGSPRDRRLAEAGLLLTVLIWSANFVVVKAAIGELGPLTFTAARFVVATLTLFLMVRWRMGAIRRPTGLTLQLIGLGMLGF
ncbi:MAG: DMT family transporter, partial [Chloroflexi bacterium]|nr:DMT family transporter [Chloroflexota bacterium]